MNGFKLNKFFVSALSALTLACASFASTAYAEPMLNVDMQVEASAQINLNTANKEQLSSLPGIGAKKAAQIIEYRDLNGEFESVDELQNVKGIGPKMLAKIATKVSV